VTAYLNVSHALQEKNAEWLRAETERAKAEKARDQAVAAAYQARFSETRALRLATNRAGAARS